MKPVPTETPELLHRVRQQLILAQVRIMELEDIRDEITPRLTDTEKLLTSAQTLADQKSEESTHLAKTLSALQAQYDHLRHMQHVTNEALNDTRRQLAETTSQLTTSRQQGEKLQKDITSLTAQVALLTANLQKADRELTAEKSLAATRLSRINELDSELRTLKGSRSWRWTRGLRALERFFGNKQP